MTGASAPARVGRNHGAYREKHRASAPPRSRLQARLALPSRGGMTRYPELIRRYAARLRASSAAMKASTSGVGVGEAIGGMPISWNMRSIGTKALALRS